MYKTVIRAAMLCGLETAVLRRVGGRVGGGRGEDVKVISGSSKDGEDQK